MGLFKRKKAESGQIPLLAADDPRLRALFDLMTMEKVFNVPLNVRTRDIAVEEAILVTDSGKQYLKAYTRDPNSHDSGEEIIWGGAEGYKVVELAGSMDGIDGIVIDDEYQIPMSLVLMMHLAPPPIPGFQSNRKVTQERVRIAMLRENRPSTQPPSGKSVAASEDWPGANQATEPDNYRLSVAGSDGRPYDAQHFLLLQFWMEPTAPRELLLRALEMADASSFDYELGNAAIDALLASDYLHTLENHEFSITELGLQECIRWNLEYDLLISKPSGMLDYTVDMVQYLVSEREPRISEEALSRILAPYIDKYTALYNRNR